MMRRQKQFKGTQQRRAFFDRKVNHIGSTRSLSMTKVLPEGWAYVRITLLHRTEQSIEVLIERLLEMNNIAPDTTINMRNKQNT